MKISFLNPKDQYINNEHEVYKSYNNLNFQEDKIMEKEKTIKEEIQEFYLNGGTYNELEIDFGTPKGSEAL